MRAKIKSIVLSIRSLISMELLNLAATIAYGEEKDEIVNFIVSFLKYLKLDPDPTRKETSAS